MFTDGIRQTCGLSVRECVLTKEDMDDINYESLVSPFKKKTVSSISLIGISADEAFSVEAEQWSQKSKKARVSPMRV